MKNYETIKYKGCTINIHQDESPENPFEAWDCEPPLLTCYDGRPKAYQNAPENWYQVLRLLPDSCFQRGNRVAFFRKFLVEKYSMREWAEETRNMGTIDAIAELLISAYGAFPSGWRDAIEWMDVACDILEWGGIAAISSQSTGYSQGDCQLVLAIATPEWLKLTGVTKENEKAQLEAGIKLYGQWAWGDVYGFTCSDESGNELEEIGSSVWGFYGSDHTESGLLEAAHEAIDQHIAAQAKESATLEAAFTF